MLRGCVPDSVSLRFEFSFMNGSSFAVLGSFGVVLAKRQELESQVQQLVNVRSSSMLERLRRKGCKSHMFPRCFSSKGYFRALNVTGASCMSIHVP